MNKAARKDPTAAARVARLRARGRRVEVILQDRAAIAALDRLTRETGSMRAAVEAALVEVGTN